jgi:beta-glucanase (GH16 family)
VEFSIKDVSDGPAIISNFYLFFGKVECNIQCAPGQGIVSAFFLFSDARDEIDWEIIGSETSEAQTNYFGKGSHSSPGSNDDTIESPQTTFHTYTIDWTVDSITWEVDGKVIRTLTPSDAGGIANYPQTPMMIRIGDWVGGNPANAAGTIGWAGGLADFTKAPFNMYLKSCSVTNYNPGSSYTYSDKSGSWQSIVVNKDPDTSDSSSAAPSSTSAPTSVPSPASSSSSPSDTSAQADPSPSSATSIASENDSSSQGQPSTSIPSSDPPQSQTSAASDVSQPSLIASNSNGPTSSASDSGASTSDAPNSSAPTSSTPASDAPNSNASSSNGPNSGGSDSLQSTSDQISNSGSQPTSTPALQNCAGINCSSDTLDGSTSQHSFGSGSAPTSNGPCTSQTPNSILSQSSSSTWITGSLPTGNSPPGNSPPGNSPPGNSPPGGNPPGGMPSQISSGSGSLPSNGASYIPQSNSILGQSQSSAWTTSGVSALGYQSIGYNTSTTSSKTSLSSSPSYKPATVTTNTASMTMNGSNLGIRAVVLGLFLYIAHNTLA